MTLLVLFAQVATDPLSGGAGWVGTGLLGSVLGWLLFVHLPNKDKQILGLIESRDKLIEKITTEFRDSVAKFVEQSETRDKERRNDFREALKQVTDSCEREISVITSEIKKDIQALLAEKKGNH